MPPVVLLVHGCGSSHDVWRAYSWVQPPNHVTTISHPSSGSAELYSATGLAVFGGQTVFLLDYSLNVHGIEHLANLLKGAVDHAKSSRDVDQVVIGTHSMGALIARTYVQGQANGVSYTQDVAGLYMIAPPNAGCAWVNRLTARGARIFTCRQAGQLAPKGQFMTHLNSAPLPRSIRYLIATGRRCLLPLFGYHDGVIRGIDTQPTGRSASGFTYSAVLIDARHYGGVCVPVCGANAPILGEGQTKAAVNLKFASDFP